MAVGFYILKIIQVFDNCKINGISGRKVRN